MPRIPSKTIKIGDAIRLANELVDNDEARKLIKSLGVMYYNTAVQEIYLLLNYIDVESLTQKKGVNLTSISAKHYMSDLNADEDFDSYDKILQLEIVQDSTTLDLQRVQLDEFLHHKQFGSAQFPYNASVIYAEIDNTLEFLWGQDLSVSTPTCTVYFTKQPTIYTSADYTTAYIEVPDKYFSLLTNRIASYAEMRNGISNNALAMVKMAYEQLLASANPVIASKFINSLQSNEVNNGSRPLSQAQ